MADLMQQARELLPCPFCGEAAKHTVWGDAGFNKVECTYCDVGMDYFYHQDDAFEAWNRRAALRAAPEGCVLVPVQTLESIRDSSTDPNARGFAAGALAARPQGVR
ncbi:Lar family restriction alleviation protein [Stenotrophomonas acidaminiphila]|uniref:Lar family restriction alleviation protein n=1 Tax=Stenotrophomonas acidaminiphila TaxID=128780 RepID=UPI0028A63000|nr:Lar family restriction alleviation protein [Stenotrophomonas acidaminiphila]